MANQLSILGIVGVIVDLVSILSSVVATLRSSAYNSERISRNIRELDDEIEKLDKYLCLLGELEHPSRLLSKNFGLNERDCWTALQRTTPAAAHIPSRI